MDLSTRARVATARLDLAAFGFNPGQRRGPDGRFIKMGGKGSAGKGGFPKGHRPSEGGGAGAGGSVEAAPEPHLVDEREELRQTQLAEIGTALAAGRRDPTQARIDRGEIAIRRHADTVKAVGAFPDDPRWEQELREATADLEAQGIRQESYGYTQAGRTRGGERIRYNAWGGMDARVGREAELDARLEAADAAAARGEPVIGLDGRYVKPIKQVATWNGEVATRTSRTPYRYASVVKFPGSDKATILSWHKTQAAAQRGTLTGLQRENGARVVDVVQARPETPEQNAMGGAARRRLDMLEANAITMYGSDESKWPAKAQKDIARLRKQREAATMSGIANIDVFAMPDDLADYWIQGEGAAKIRWCTEGAFDRARRALREHVPGPMLDGTVANLYRRACGKWPGQRRLMAVVTEAQRAAFSAMRYDPSQARDRRGRWTDGFPGAGGGQFRERLASRVAGLRASIDSGIESVTEMGQGRMSEVRRLHFADGSDGVAKTVKKGASGLNAADTVRSETLMASVAAALGVRAPAVIRTGPKEMIAELVEGETGAIHLWPSDYVRGGPRVDVARQDALMGSPDGIRLALMDALTNQQDRHDGNWMVDPQGNLVAIDNGLAFAEPRSNNPFEAASYNRFIKTHFVDDRGRPKANPLTPADIETARARLESLRSEFVGLKREKWLDTVLERLELLGQHASGTQDLLAGGGLTASAWLAFNPRQLRGPDGRWIKMGGRGSAPSSGAPRVTRYARGEVKETPGTTPGAHSSYAFTSDGRTRILDLQPHQAGGVADLLAAGRDAALIEGSPRAGGTHYSRVEMRAGPAAGDPIRLTLWPHGGPPEPVEIEMTKQQARELAARMRANAAFKPPKPLTIPGQPQYAARVKRLQAGAASGVESEQRIGMGIMGKVDRVRHNNGMESIRKDVQGGSSALGGSAFHTAADQNAAEELSGLVAAALGMRAPVVTPTSATESYIELMPGVPAVTQLAGSEGHIVVPPAIRDSPSVRRMAVLDLLIDNGDRNAGNWLVDGDETIPIDHGMAFAPRHSSDTSAATGPFSAPYLNKNGTFNKNNPLTPQDIEMLRARIGSLRPQFAARSRAPWLDQMMHRLDLLAAGARGTADIFPTAATP